MAVLETLKSLLLNRRIGVMVLLGFASGLPLELTGGTLQLWLSDEGVDLTALGLSRLLPFLPAPAQLPGTASIQGMDLTTIALFTLVGLPYVLKVFWSPLMDRFVPPFLGRRRGWMVVTQLSLMGALVGMALTSPIHSPLALAVFAIVVAFASASQDIVLDAYRTDVLHEEERGFGAAVFVTGYRVAMLVAGGLAAILGQEIGWQNAYFAMAALMGMGLVATLIAPPPEREARAPKTLALAVVAPLRELFSREAALWLIAAVIVYKLGDAFAGSLLSAFLRKELEFSPTDIGVVRKTVGFVSVLGGMLVGGVLMARLGLFRSLILFSVLQGASNLVFIALAESGHDYPLMVATIAVENVTGGMGTAAFVALLMALCDHRFTATQYALLSAVASLGRVVVGPLAGPLVENVGWTPFFAISALITAPALALLWRLRPILGHLGRESETRGIESS